MDTVRFDSPADYQIAISGKLDIRYFEILDKANITVLTEGTELKSVIQIRIKDQAHLIGILNMLYDWHYVILGVANEKYSKHK